MRTMLIGVVALFVTVGQAAWAADEHPAAPTPPDGDINTHPWNPDLHYADDWPYAKPQVIETDYCGPPGEFWLGAEFFLWALKGGDLPPLATGGGTFIGGDSPSANPYYGGRFTGGVWFESAYKVGFEGNYFFLADQAVRRAAALPGAGPGFVSEAATTELQGAEGMFVWNLSRCATWDCDLLAGFRYVDLGGELQILSNTFPVAGGSTLTGDELTARNHFYGGEVEGRAHYRWHALVLTCTEKLALGGRTTEIGVFGGTVAASPTGTVQNPAVGLLAQTGNIGRHSDDTFAVVNEVGVQAGWQICDYVQAFVGYTFFYFSSVVRPGDVLAPSGGAAAFAPRATDFWAHGLNVGLEVRY